MGAKSPDEAEYVLPVEHPLLRRFATFVRENQLLAGLLIAGFGIGFSFASLIFPFFVLPDVVVDITAAFLSVVYFERVVTEEASITAGASVNVEETVVEGEEN